MKNSAKERDKLSGFDLLLHVTDERLRKGDLSVLKGQVHNIVSRRKSARSKSLETFLKRLFGQLVPLFIISCHITSFLMLLFIFIPFSSLSSSMTIASLRCTPRMEASLLVAMHEERLRRGGGLKVAELGREAALNEIWSLPLRGQFVAVCRGGLMVKKKNRLSHGKVVRAVPGGVMLLLLGLHLGIECGPAGGEKSLVACWVCQVGAWWGGERRRNGVEAGLVSKSDMGRAEVSH